MLRLSVRQHRYPSAVSGAAGLVVHWTVWLVTLRSIKLLEIRETYSECCNVNSVTKTTAVRDLMLGSGVMLLVYGLAIAALVAWFVLDSRKDDAGVVEIPSTQNSTADTTIAAADAGVAADASVELEGVALSDFVAVPASEIDRSKTVVDPIAKVSETQAEQGSESVQSTPLVPGQPIQSAQGPTVVAGEGAANAEVLVSSYDDRPVLTVTGRVINQLQAPIAGLRVFVYHADNDGESIASAVTNRGGDFHLPALEKAPYIVKTAFGDTISVFDFARSGSVDLHIVSQQGTEVATAAAESAPKAPDTQLASTVSGNAVATGTQIFVSGRVQSDLGAPLADVLVRYNGTTLMQTGIDGSYNISLQPSTASKVSIQYKKEGHLAEIRTITAQTWGKSNQLRQDVVMRSIKMQ